MTDAELDECVRDHKKRMKELTSNLAETGGTIADIDPKVLFIDVLIQALRTEREDKFDEMNRVEELSHDKKVLMEAIIKVIDMSGIEEIYNWGGPLRNIRSLIEEARAALDKVSDKVKEKVK